MYNFYRKPSADGKAPPKPNDKAMEAALFDLLSSLQQRYPIRNNDLAHVYWIGVYASGGRQVTAKTVLALNVKESALQQLITLAVRGKVYLHELNSDV